MSIEKKMSPEDPLPQEDVDSTKTNDKKDFNNIWPPKKDSRPREKINLHNHYRKPK